MALRIVTDGDSATKRALQEALTARLPAWFGDPASNRHYAVQAEALPGLIARRGGRDIGLLLLKRHGPASAEIYWLAVDPDAHGEGAGRALVEAAGRLAAAEGRRFLFAKSLAPDHPNPEYRRTRAFYERLGFVLAATEHGEEAPEMAWYVKVLA